jgi:hypothetical protein
MSNLRLQSLHSTTHPPTHSPTTTTATATCTRYQAQLVCLAIQIVWCEMLDAALDKGGGDALKGVQEHVDRTLTCMADTVLRFQPPILRFVSFCPSAYR